MPARFTLAAAIFAVVSVLWPTPSAHAQPPNVGDAKTIAREYHDSGRYAADLAAVNADATGWIRERTPGAARPAVVFDIDETALSNWEVIVANDFGRVVDGPCDPPGFCAWRPWDLLARATAIPSTLDTFTTARDLGAAIFFITGRDSGQRAATEQNLAATGYGGYTELIMAPAGAKYASAADFKAPRRAAIAARGYTIVANIGDQPSDIAGGYAERTFLLPDPFYRIP